MTQENENVGYSSFGTYAKLPNTNNELFESFERIRKRPNFKHYKIEESSIKNTFYTTKNKKCINQLCNRIYDINSIFTISKYVKQHTMYMIVLDIDLTKINLNDDVKKPFEKIWEKLIIFKIGYTFNLQERLVELQNMFKCNVYVLGLKYVNSEHDEKFFHNKILKKGYKNSEFCIQVNIDNRKKTLSEETYIGTLNIMNEFDEYQVSVNNEFLIEQEKNKRIENEIKLKEKEVELKNKELELINKDIELKDKDIELMNIKCKNEIEILKLQIKLEKLKNK